MAKTGIIHERRQWFIDRVGKRVFRNKTSCECKSCDDVYSEGVIVFDTNHAHYICDLESEYTIEGSPFHYFDTIKERDEYELTLKKEL